jgi:hypothetical protein
MKVKVTSSKMFGGHKAGTIGTIISIDGAKCFIESDKGDLYYNHISEVVPLEDENLKAIPIEKFLLIPASCMSSGNEVMKPNKEFLSEKSAMSYIRKHTLEYEGYVLCKIVPLVKIESEADIEVIL